MSKAYSMTMKVYLKQEYSVFLYLDFE